MAKTASKKSGHKHSLANAPDERSDRPSQGIAAANREDEGSNPSRSSKLGKVAIAETKHVKDLKPFRQQVRRHTPRNMAMIGDSINDVGFARSIVIDENDEILAGAGSNEAAGERGLENVRIIDTDGTEVIAIRRSGLTPLQKLKLALADNRAGDLAEYDTAAMAAALKAPGIDPKQFFTDAELRHLEDRQLANDLRTGAENGKTPAKDTVPSIPEGYTTFTLVISKEADAEIREALDDAKQRTGLNTVAEALLVIVRAYNQTRSEAASR